LSPAKTIEFSPKAPTMTTNPPSSPTVRLALPKGRMEQGVLALLADAGIKLRSSSRNYRPDLSLPGFEVKVLKPQNIIEMLHVGSRDVGFAGADWVAELGAELVELLDTGLDPVRLVAAAPAANVRDGRLDVARRPMLIVSEHQNLTQSWINSRKLDARFVKSFGATEVFPPEDADAIVDVAASGATLAANGLLVFDELIKSSTRLYASRAAMADPAKKSVIERLVMLLRSVLEARRRVMLEVNVTQANLEAVVKVLPCMREPTIATLHGSGGFAVKAAVPRELLPTLIPDIKAKGGTDIVVSNLSQIVP
jgi:ATP phosphoribosyltransferase